MGGACCRRGSTHVRRFVCVVRPPSPRHLSATREGCLRRRRRKPMRRFDLENFTARAHLAHAASVKGPSTLSKVINDTDKQGCARYVDYERSLQARFK
ncbi:hypothetical protein EVAR_13835_1 [Eumeta japonica]|uniref:Uncharacterized protein n=1 Tax=Eumeta variegata TaxID=151549 RepID=A0A4C1U112_EUMVA|nr:hypothetical protein EVAR_13835_1 [Eumeta japonica]